MDLPDVWVYSTRERDVNHYLELVNYNELTNGELWLLRDGGFTLEECNKISINLLEIPPDPANSIPLEKMLVLQDNTSDRYDIKIQLPETAPNTDYLLSVDGEGIGLGINAGNYFLGNAAYVGGYTIGFSHTDEGGYRIINEGNWRYDVSSNNSVDSYSLFREIQIAAGEKKEDEQGAVYFDVSKAEKKVGLKIVRLWIEPVSGEKTVFSLSPDAYVSEMTNLSGTNVLLYSKQGSSATIRLWAEVEVTINNKTQPEHFNVSAICDMYAPTTVTIRRPDNDTVEELNAYLQELSKTIVPDSFYTVTLPPITYTGTIIIPSNFNAGQHGTDLILEGTAGSDGTFTKLNGAINLNGAIMGRVENVHFKATDACTTAIYGGSLLNMYTCSFEGYNIALKSTAGLITVSSGNVFVDNDIAIHLDISATRGGINLCSWANNTFIGNRTAIQVLSLNEFLSSYYFRIVDSNFIDNTTDFDVRCNATLYMYRNYYGNIHNKSKDMSLHDFLKALYGATVETKLNQLVTSNSPNIQCNHSITKIITNPRWKYPVLDWWHSPAAITDVFPASSVSVRAAADEEERYTNILIPDWNLATQIINEEADDLVIDKSAFDSQGEKQIDVVDKDETPLGTWTFD